MIKRKLSFGCGNDIRESWVNADVQKRKGVVSFDFNSFPYPFKDNTFDYIDAKQVLQLLEHPDKVLLELRRICKNGAVIHITTSYWHNKGAYNDIQTKHFFNENSFLYFATETPCRIKKKKRFKVVSIKRNPTALGKCFPDFIRRRLDLFMSGLYSNIVADYKVIKDENNQNKKMQR